MLFDALPNELLLDIALRLDNVADLSSFIRCTRRTRYNLDRELYSHKSSVACARDLTWALRNNGDSPVRKRLAYDLPFPPDFMYDAALYGRHGILQLVLENRPSFRVQLNSDQSPPISQALHRHPILAACVRGHTAAVRVLLQYTDTDDARNVKPRSNQIPAVEVNSFTRAVHSCALRTAVAYGYCEIARLLLDNIISIIQVAEPQDSNDGCVAFHRRWSCLALATNCGFPDIVRLLISRGARVNGQVSDGTTALCCATFRNHPECAAVLLEAGADPMLRPRNMYHPLILATRFAELPTVKLLFEATLPVDIGLETCTAALEYSFAKKLDDISCYILGHDIFKELSTARPGEKSAYVHLAIKCRALKTMKVLLQQGANTRVIEKGHSPLERALRGGREDVIEVLLAHSPDLLRPAANGYTALDFTARLGNLSVCKLLVERYGVDVNQQSAHPDRTTALHEAVRRKKTAVVMYLLRQGADPNIRDSRGWTPLHVAVVHGGFFLVKSLVAFKADVYAMTLDWFNPFQLAHLYGKLDAARLLEHDMMVHQMLDNNSGCLELYPTANHL